MDDLEVRSASATHVERKEIGFFGNRLFKDDFGKSHVGLHDASARNLGVGVASGTADLLRGMRI